MSEVQTKKPLKLNKNIVPLRVEMSQSMFDKLVAVAKSNGYPFSVELRQALAELEFEDIAFDKPDFPIWEEVKGDRIPPANTAVRISASEKEKLELLEKMSGKTRVKGFILRQLIARIIRDGERKATKLAKKNIEPQEPVKRFSFMVGERYQPLSPGDDNTTAKIISKLAFDLGITISELYRRALQNFSGKIYDETGKMVLACVMMTAEDKALLEKLSKKHNAKFAAVMRSAIYEEIERCRSMKKSMS